MDLLSRLASCVRLTLETVGVYPRPASIMLRASGDDCFVVVIVCARLVCVHAVPRVTFVFVRRVNFPLAVTPNRGSKRTVTVKVKRSCT